MSEPKSRRYMVQGGSNSCHCCFEYTVVDTTISTGYDPKPHATVCETFDEASADLIAKALNFLEDNAAELAYQGLPNS